MCRYDSVSISMPFTGMPLWLQRAIVRAIMHAIIHAIMLAISMPPPSSMPSAGNSMRLLHAIIMPYACHYAAIMHTYLHVISMPFSKLFLFSMPAPSSMPPLGKSLRLLQNSGDAGSSAGGSGMAPDSLPGSPLKAFAPPRKGVTERKVNQGLGTASISCAGCA